MKSQRRIEVTRPRHVDSAPIRIGVLLVCVFILAAVFGVESYVQENPTLGGFLLLAILVATWLLPARLSAVVVLAAFAVPLATTATGTVDVLTGRFQLIAILATAFLSEMTVRGLQAREQADKVAAERLLQFTADAAHELRNPLAALRSDLETTLRQPRSADDLTATVQRALNNTERLVRISESLLTLSQGDAGVLATHKTDVDVSDVLEEASARWQRHADQLGVTLHKRFTCEATLQGDSVLLGRLLDNLLENALRHTPSGGDVTVELLGDAVSRKCVVAVSDTGPGIPESLRSSLFERFTRGDPSRSRRTGGAGLGLALCRAIVTAHQGAIALDARTTAGTRIVVTLPVTSLYAGV